MRLPHPLLVISDRKLARRPLADVLEAAFAAGCRWVMLREKDLPAPALEALARELMALARRWDAAVSINGNAEVALAVGAAGVHLPQGRSPAAARRRLGSDALIGVSAHGRGEASAAAAAGADYVTLSPIFASVSKPGYGPALGLATLRRAAEGLPIPVLALGGVTPENVAACRTAGAAGIAVLGTVMAAERPGEAVAALLARFQNSTAWPAG